MSLLESRQAVLGVWGRVKLQALVYDILPSTTSVFSEFFDGAQTVVSLLQTTQIKQGVSFIAANKVYTRTNKTTIVWIEKEHGNIKQTPDIIWVVCNKLTTVWAPTRKLLVSWQFSGTYGVTKYGSGWRKDVVNHAVVGVWPDPSKQLTHWQEKDGADGTGKSENSSLFPRGTSATEACCVSVLWSLVFFSSFSQSWCGQPWGPWGP